MANQRSKGNRLMNNNLLKKYSVLWLHSQNKSIDEISEELDIAKSSVKRTVKLYAESNTETKETDNHAIQSSRKTSKDFMINQTAGKGTSGVTIMTRAASEMNDASKKSNNNQDTKFANCIYKLDPNK